MSTPTTSLRRSTQTNRWAALALVQFAALVLGTMGWALPGRWSVPASVDTAARAPEAAIVPLRRNEPLTITPLHDDPGVVSREELAEVLRRIIPRMPRKQLKPNHVEHALRTWSQAATFRDPRAISGAELKEFLTNHGEFLASWGAEQQPLLVDRPTGVAVHWGKDACASVHHDHLLACVTEAGVKLDEPIYTLGHTDRRMVHLLREALADFKLDEAEVEWSALAFGLWLPPQQTWTTRSGRVLSFDLLAERLMRGSCRFGVCLGTHRVYSLMVLWRLDEEYHILSPTIRNAVWEHLLEVRDQIAASQFEDGHWSSNWPQGADALTNPANDELYKQIIATGHHLEWLALAPAELHPPKEQIYRAARWCRETLRKQTDAQVASNYTFLSHVGVALSLWRKTTPCEFWVRWEAEHPEEGRDVPATNTEPKSAEPAVVEPAELENH